jgi:hypothetical protein
MVAQVAFSSCDRAAMARRMWILFSILYFNFEGCNTQASTVPEIKTEFARDQTTDDLKAILDMYGIKEDVLLQSTNSSQESEIQDRRFEFGERLIQLALHEETDTTKVNEMRIRIKELINRPTQKESDPRITTAREDESQEG